MFSGPLHSWEADVFDDRRSLSFSSASVRSSVSSSVSLDRKPISTLLSSSNGLSDADALSWLPDILRKYIIHRCTLNEHCSESDFDQTALEALSRLPFLQSMQTVEHFTASVSSRIHKKAAYLMGILRGQEAHWEKFGVGLSQSHGHFKGRQLVEMPGEILLFIGRSCLTGHCLPSDFTPEVCLSLHGLVLPLAVKAISAFNSNKRIVAGAKGGVINRARFFLRLIQNISDQSSSSRESTYETTRYQMKKTTNPPKSPSNSSSISHESVEEAGVWDTLSKDLNTEISTVNVEPSSPEKPAEINLEQLAELDFGAKPKKEVEDEMLLRKIAILEKEVTMREQRELLLLRELAEMKQRVKAMQTEYLKLRTFVRLH